MAKKDAAWPTVAPGPADQGDDYDAADQLSQLVAGNQHLITHPHLVSALQQANATPQQAQAINLFVGGMQASGRVTAAMQSGTKITLSDDEKAGLATLGIDYSSVENTPAAAPGGATGGTSSTPSSGASAQPAQKKKGWSLGRIVHDVTHNDVTNVIGQGYNLAMSSIASGAQNFAQGITDPTNYNAGRPGPANVANTDAQDAENEAAKAAGYDPTSKLSMLAYAASGKKLLDVSDLYAKNDPNQVDAAVKFADNPSGYIKSIAGNQSLTPDQAAAQLDQVNNPDFQKLVMQVQSRKATPGNLATAGIDPVAHPTEHALISGATDVAVSFLIDPTNAALGALKGVRMTKIALDSLGDTNKVRNVLDGTQKGLYATQVRRGVQSLIDNTTAIREAIAKGDNAAAAAGWAKLRNETPGLEHLAADFMGGSRAVGFQAGENAIRFEKAAPITNMAEATDYLASKVGVVRLMGGKPTLEGTLMPGQLSKFGAKKLRGALAAGMASRSVTRNEKLLFNLNKPGVAARILPTVEDSADTATGTIINGADDTADTAGALASQARANAIAAGDARFAARSGLLSPSGYYNRGNLVIQRLTSFLPRTTTFSIDDPKAATGVFQYAKMYLTNGDANLLAARYAAGDEGARKAILTGLHLQTLHAAGLGTTEAGRAIITRAEQALTDQRYSSVGDLDKIVNPDTGLTEPRALWDTQVGEKMTLTRFDELQKYAAKIGLWESTVGRGLNSQLVDNLMGIVKPGWLITGTNVVRNSGEDLVGAALRGEFGDVARARAQALDKGLLPKRTKLGNLVAAPLARVAQLYHHVAINTADESLGLKYIADLDPDLAHTIADNWTRLHAGSMVDPAGVADTDAITQAGYRPRRMRFTRTGFGPVDVTEDQVGAERLSNALGRVINGNPRHFDAVMSHIEDPDTFDISSVVASLRTPDNWKKVNQMTRASVYKDDAGVWRKAITPEEHELALTQLAQDQVADARYLLQGKDGTLNKDLVNRIREVQGAPDSSWIMKNMTGEMRPPTVNAPMYEAEPLQGGVTGIVGAISDIAGRGYQTIVERPIARISSMPIFLSNYGKERALLEPIERHMVESGLTEEAASKAAQQLALDKAFNRTVKYIDDPTLRTQMDIVGRNFFAFSRATQAFIRRWGTQFIEDPARLRKAMLTMEAAQRTGVTYTDENGQKQFMYPGSGLAIQALQHVQDLIPGVNVLRVPGITPNLTGQVALLQPGLQNPLQMSLTPMINIPMRSVFSLFPQHKEALDEVDTFLNGQQGQGQPWYSELEPTTIKKFSDALDNDSRDSMTADATRSAILNLAAAGQTPPPGADPATVATFINNLRTQVKNQLVLRAVFGFFTPSPPGHPTEETSGSNADWFYGATGIKDLDSEYKKLINDSGGDVARASQIWTALHPDKLVYTVGTTTNATKSAVYSATQAAQNWIESNVGFMNKYKGVSAYFIPLDTQKGDFSLAAYNAELQMGLRQHKTIDPSVQGNFYQDVASAGAAAEYYAALDARNAAIAKDPANASKYNSRFSTWKKGFDSLNPQFAATQADYGLAATTALGQLSTLRNMVAGKDVPKDVPVADVKQMISAYDTYHKTIEAHPGNTNYAVAIRKSVTSQYSDYMQGIVKNNPQLAGLYQGVFRSIDSSALDSLETN